MAVHKPVLRVVSPPDGTSITTTETPFQWGHVASGDTAKLFLDLEPFRIRQVGIRFKADGTTALNSLKIFGKVHADDDTWIPLAIAAADYTGGANKYVADSQRFNSSDVFQDKDVTAVGATDWGFVVINCPGFARLRITTTTAAGTSTVTSYAFGHPDDVHMQSELVQVHATISNNVGLLDKAEAEIEPAGGQKSNVAAAGADHLSASGLVRKDTPALVEAVAAGDWLAMSGNAVGEQWVSSSEIAAGTPTSGNASADADGSVREQLKYLNDSADTIKSDTTALEAALVGPAAPTIDSYTTIPVDLAAAGDNQELVATPGASKQIWVYGFAVLSAAAATLQLLDDADAAMTGTMTLGANGGIAIQPSSNFAMPWIKVTTNKALDAKTVGVGGTMDGLMTYAIVSV